MLMLTNLKRLVHTTTRARVDLRLFKFPCSAVMLDFVGAEKYFITEFGGVWERGRTFPNNFDILNKGYLPMVKRDLEFPYPWVKLNTTGGELWFPVNQLLGWAFNPSEDENDKYYVCKHPGVLPLDLNDFKWEPELKHEKRGEYIKFMYSIYGC